MQSDWQTITVALIIFAAFFYVARRAYARLRAFSKSSGATCETGCGKCDGQPSQLTTARSSAKPLVRITRTR